MALQREMKPYLDVATAAEKVVAWKNNAVSRKWLAVCLFVAFFIDYFWEMFHAAICALLVRNYFAKVKLDTLKAEAMSVFVRIDADGGDPPIWEDYRAILKKHNTGIDLEPIEKWDFYDAVASPHHVLTIQTADQALFANLLLTIGVRKPGE